MSYTNLRIIPMPKEVIGEDQDGNFAILKIRPAIHTDAPEFQQYIDSFSEYASRIHGVNFENAAGGVEVLCDKGLGKGAYKLCCLPEGVRISACEKDGVNYALSTLLQLICADDEGVSLPFVTIKDRPDCPFRAFMVDLARQWHEFDTLFEYVDLCYLYKIKYLHLHFVDNQSYTLPSDIFPAISTEGRHYTKQQIAQLNKYALERNVELIPELEVPGHALAMVNAYPELFGNTLDPQCGDVKLHNAIICAGKPGVMDNIKKLFGEVCEMFPNSSYIHVGGDEAEIGEWNSCSDCKKYMKEHEIEDVHALYSHFVKLVTDVVLDLGRTPIVWEGFPRKGSEDISHDVMVIAWESYYHLAPELVEEGFNIINASWQPLYITPSVHWSVENILAWNVYNWQHWGAMSPAKLNPIHLQPTFQVKGALLCAWENNYDGEIPIVRENLAALSERTWNIKRYAEDKQFREKLDYILEMARKLAVK